jgi:hypothetical protein
VTDQSSRSLPSDGLIPFRRSTRASLVRLPPPPIWEQFAPAPPAGLGKIFGGGERFERQTDIARAAYARAVELHTAAEANARRQLAEQRAVYDAAAAAFAAEVAEHNAGIDQFQRDCRAGDLKLLQSSAPLSWTPPYIRRGFRTRHVLCTGQIRGKPSLSGSCHRNR